MSKNLKTVFWDVDTKLLDDKKHADYIITRIAEFGTLEQTKWLRKKYSKKRIKEVVANSCNVSPKSKSYWAII